LAQSDSWGYCDRKEEALLIRLLFHVVARWAVAAHQNAEWMTSGGWPTIGGCGPTTDLCRAPPDHLRVMSARKPILRCQYATMIILLFVDPVLHALANTRKITCKILTDVASVGVVTELACRRQMLSPSLGLGSEIVAPNEGRDSNGSALAVVHGQDGVDEIRAHISGIVSRLCQIGWL
jgi:hypothetical protein